MDIKVGAKNCVLTFECEYLDLDSLVLDFIGDGGVQPFSRQRVGIALGHDFYRDANTILPNNLCEDEFSASIVVVACLTFKDIIKGK